MIEIFKWILVALSIPFIVKLAKYNIERAKELSQRIDEYHEEQEAKKNQKGPINPYADMAEAFGVDIDSEDKKQEDDK